MLRISIGSGENAREKIIKMHALAMNFVNIATLVFVMYAYHYFCKCTQYTCFLKQIEYFINSLSQLF